MRSFRPHQRNGFTLVELLVVMLIIGLLAALLLPAIMRAQESARQLRMTNEIKQIAMAFETLSQTNGGVYPPTFNDVGGGSSPSAAQQANRAAVQRYLLRAFPRSSQLNGSNWWTTSQSGLGKPENLDPAEAIVFWLGLLNNDALQPLPYSPQPSAVQKKTFFEFDPSRLKDFDGDGWPEFVLRDAPDSGPLVFFSSANYAYGSGELARYPLASTTFSTTPPFQGVARPYSASTANGSNATGFVEPNRFQLIFAGVDKDFGEDIYTAASSGSGVNFAATKAYPNDRGVYKKGDLDNLTSFSEGKKLGDARP